MLKIFDGRSEEFNDASYKNWLVCNQAAVVLTTNRAVASEYARLHKATCHYVLETARGQGANPFTGKGYIKVCSDNVGDIFIWASAHNRPLCRPCSHCKPDIGTDIREALELETPLADDGIDLNQTEKLKTLAAIVLRRGQTAFRNGLLRAYDRRCAVTGCDAESALEAAHIYPYNGNETNKTFNGILLRADIHTLFDLGEIDISPDSYTVIITNALKLTAYSEYDGVQIRLPLRRQDQPSKKSLHLRREHLAMTERARMVVRHSRGDNNLK